MRIVLQEDVSISGYAAEDPEEPGKVRLDGMVLGETGHLEKVSLQLAQDDIAAVHFLHESPVFLDLEGNEFTMERRFFPEL